MRKSLWFAVLCLPLLAPPGGEAAPAGKPAPGARPNPGPLVCLETLDLDAAGPDADAGIDLPQVPEPEEWVIPPPRNDPSGPPGSHPSGIDVPPRTHGAPLPLEPFPGLYAPPERRPR